MIDRLTHHAEIVPIEGKSYRLKEAHDHKPLSKKGRA
jgi:DNA replication protein DnaC